jgi:putative FmdB family regulatory protein
MPIYEYGCEAGHRFEVTQKVSDPPLTKCQVCALPVSKLISAPAISFKGAGWYVTDYSNKLKPPSKDEKSESTASSSSPTPTPSSSSSGSTGSGSDPAKPSGSSGS